MLVIKGQLVLVIKVKRVRKVHRVEVHQLVRLLLGLEVRVLYPLDISYVMVQQLVDPHTQLFLLLLEQHMVLEMDLLHSTSLI